MTLKLQSPIVLSNVPEWARRVFVQIGHLIRSFLILTYIWVISENAYPLEHKRWMGTHILLAKTLEIPVYLFQGPVSRLIGYPEPYEVPQNLNLGPRHEIKFISTHWAPDNGWFSLNRTVFFNQIFRLHLLFGLPVYLILLNLLGYMINRFKRWRLTSRSSRTPPALPGVLFLVIAISAPLSASVQAGPLSFIR